MDAEVGVVNVTTPTCGLIELYIGLCLKPSVGSNLLLQLSYLFQPILLDTVLNTPEYPCCSEKKI